MVETIILNRFENLAGSIERISSLGKMRVDSGPLPFGRTGGGQPFYTCNQRWAELYERAELVLLT